MRRSNSAIKIKDSIIVLNIGPFDERRVISKWPAIMLAVRRTAKVPGRIRFLIVSIRTMKGIKIAGVPLGIKWINMFWVLLIHPKNIKVNQIGREKVKLKIRCLVDVKMYGYRPRKLLKKIIKNKVIKKIEFPLKFFVFNKLLISNFKKFRIKVYKYIYRFEINQ